MQVLGKKVFNHATSKYFFNTMSTIFCKRNSWLIKGTLDWWKNHFFWKKFLIFWPLSLNGAYQQCKNSQITINFTFPNENIKTNIESTMLSTIKKSFLLKASSSNIIKRTSPNYHDSSQTTDYITQSTCNQCLNPFLWSSY